MANYYISGIWKDGGHITHVMLHAQTANGIGKGAKQTEAHAIALLRADHTIITIEWDYAKANWKKGADVGHETVGGRTYLRSHQNRTVNDNLEHLIRMEYF